MRRYHAAGILFWYIDENNDTWVLVGRRKTSPACEKWSIPIVCCTIIREKGHARVDYKNTAMTACKKQLGIVLQNDKNLTLLGVKKNLFETFHVFAYQLESAELPPLKNDFHMVMWSKSTEVPKPNTIFFHSLLNTFNKQQQTGSAAL